ncbi:MogA/MoaB family molybdenum cofactor biosynthesis protein [Halorientalis salina]|uniref:MogA/MoaB family molybdenum cofactor biosynthesis protein n=1 Tax=Halorientalis salina TaxID=2932266 RepID=UPI0010AC17C4|nr:MogA/MoaB family molybdenum cofactor biosynthesis protein [Halorientalis salina]
MVDFQSRDSRYTDDDAADEEDEDADPPDDDPGGDDHGDHAEHDQHADHTDHDHHAHDKADLGVGIVTVSSTRTREDDPSGDAIQAAVENAGHEIAVRDVVRDNYDGIQNAVDALVSRSDVDLVLTTGGTGVTPDDVTVEASEPLFDKELPGFGELLRLLSYEKVGTKAICTRATAGIADGVPVFCLPGSEDAATLGVEEIILPEAAHLAGLATRE